MNKTKFMTRIFSAIEKDETEVLEQLDKDLDIAKEDGSCEGDQYVITASDDKVILHDKVNNEDTEIIEDENGEVTFSKVDLEGKNAPDEELPLVEEKEFANNKGPWKIVVKYVYTGTTKRTWHVYPKDKADELVKSGKFMKTWYKIVGGTYNTKEEAQHAMADIKSATGKGKISDEPAKLGEMEKYALRKHGLKFSDMSDDDLDKTLECMSVKASRIKNFSLESLKLFAKGGWRDNKLYIKMGDSDVALDLKNKVAIVIDENLSCPIDPKKSFIDNLTTVEKFMKENDLKVFSGEINWEEIIGSKPNYHQHGDSGYMSLEIWEATKYALKKIKNYDGSNGPLDDDLISSFCQEGVMRKAPTWVEKRNEDQALKYVLDEVNRNKSKLSSFSDVNLTESFSGGNHQYAIYKSDSDNKWHICRYPSDKYDQASVKGRKDFKDKVEAKKQADYLNSKEGNFSDANPTPEQEGVIDYLKGWVEEHPGEAKYLVELGNKWGADNLIEGLTHDAEGDKEFSAKLQNELMKVSAILNKLCNSDLNQITPVIEQDFKDLPRGLKLLKDLLTSVGGVQKVLSKIDSYKEKLDDTEFNNITLIRKFNESLGSIDLNGTKNFSGSFDSSTMQFITDNDQYRVGDTITRSGEQFELSKLISSDNGEYVWQVKAYSKRFSKFSPAVAKMFSESDKKKYIVVYIQNHEDGDKLSFDLTDPNDAESYKLFKEIQKVKDDINAVDRSRGNLYIDVDYAEFDDKPNYFDSLRPYRGKITQDYLDKLKSELSDRKSKYEAAKSAWMKRNGFSSNFSKFSPAVAKMFSDDKTYVVYQEGGSIGEKTNARVGSKPVRIIKEGLTEQEAKDMKSRWNKMLTPGEKKYYGISYKYCPSNKIKKLDNSNFSKFSLAVAKMFADKYDDSDEIKRNLRKSVKDAIGSLGLQVPEAKFENGYTTITMKIHHDKVDKVKKAISKLPSDIGVICKCSDPSKTDLTWYDLIFVQK